MKYYNLENHTDKVSLDQLFQIRKVIEETIHKLQEELEGNSTSGGCYEGDGFNITFPLFGKDFFLRCALDNR